MSFYLKACYSNPTWLPTLILCNSILLTCSSTSRLYTALRRRAVPRRHFCRSCTSSSCILLVVVACRNPSTAFLPVLFSEYLAGSNYIFLLATGHLPFVLSFHVFLYLYSWQQRNCFNIDIHYSDNNVKTFSSSSWSTYEPCANMELTRL